MTRATTTPGRDGPIAGGKSHAPDRESGLTPSGLRPQEKPILFTGEMARAILAGRKTMTRRLVRIDDRPVRLTIAQSGKHQRGIPRDAKNVRMCAYYVKCDAPDGSNIVSCRVDCPYGWIGDRLWVRETWARLTGNGHRIVYRADGEDPRTGWDDTPPERRPRMTWTPSIYLRRQFSRITLEVTSVRVERLQDITEEDAKAEGVTPFPKNPEGDCWTDGKHRTAFEYLWGEINGWEGEPKARAPWGSNPWVWCLSFKRIRP